MSERLAGAVWGHLVGDALGVPYEFRRPIDPSEIRFGANGSHGQPPGTWSDDGALMLALLDSLLEKGFDTTDQAERALAWYRDGRYAAGGKVFDIGNATRRALERFERGVPTEEAGADDNALGNGSLMRMLPLALVERDVDAAVLVDHAHRASKVTHGAYVAQVACALYVLIARRLIEGRRRRQTVLSDAKAELRRLYESRSFSRNYLAALDESEAWTVRSGRGFVTDSFWSAWDAFARADSYEETVRRAVAYGNDTDTTAAIAGGLAGLRWGMEGITQDWLAGMRGKEIAQPLVDRLVGTARRKYRIYVIELNESVWSKRAIRDRNQKRRMDKPCVYVGHSELTPEKRLARHKRGRSRSRTVGRYMMDLKPRLYRNAPVAATRDEAYVIEKNWAERLRKRGFGVWEGRLGPLDLRPTGKRGTTGEPR